MRAILIFVSFGAVVALLAFTIYLTVQVSGLRKERARLRELVARVKDIAWDQRELDPNLSTVIIDEIRIYEKKELGP
ncbi:hypothetical protein [Tenggerimyces flavus]|uniref:Two-component sensor histidine kinase n=1 Tax=Tenggerimyces flavus TaxID=1708749 RepID=A0ABV7YRR5_9ACTN|nr:hypothetical protein [Tenggerimyces flavus]MBM7784674.1 hypothetical protein [Tenggerimyces flavus]